MAVEYDGDSYRYDVTLATLNFGDITRVKTMLSVWNAYIIQVFTSLLIKDIYCIV